jgi:hypothetical protein
VAEARSLRGQARVRAFALWEGPQNVEVIRDGEIAFFGWNLLGLTARYPSYPAKTLMLESRLVYANLFDETQAEVVVRGCWLDNEIILAPLQHQPSESPVAIPCRFVAVPREEIEALIGPIVGLTVPIGAVSDSNVELQVRKLLVRQDYTLCTFEKTWQSDDQSHELLNHTWNQAWAKLGMLLSEHPPLDSTDVKEYFLPTDTQSLQTAYDPSTYNPFLGSWGDQD